MALPEKLYTLRKKSGLSQEQLAEALNVSRQAISKWEGGSATPESDKLLALSNYFGVSLDYLLKDGAPNAAPAEAQEEHRTMRLLSLILCFGGAAAVGIPVYLLTRHALGGTGAMFLMIALMLPAFFMAMYERDGLPFEKVARNIIRAKFLRPGVRPYQTQNIYAPFAGKEVTLEQKPQEVKKPDAGR